jgi:hypothetical protein
MKVTSLYKTFCEQSSLALRYLQSRIDSKQSLTLTDELLQKDGVFSNLVDASGPEASAALRLIAASKAEE